MIEKKKNQYQQGDVILKKINNLPVGLEKRTPVKHRDKDCVVLAYGEVTGHAHVLDADDNIEWLEKDEKKYIHLKEKKTLTHEEHHPITLDPGIYQYSQVVEGNFFDDLVAPVRD